MNELVGYKNIEQFRIIQKKIDFMRILVKSVEGVDEKKLAKKLVANFRKGLSVDVNDMEFDVVFVEKLPKMKGGKFASVFSEVNLNQNSTN